jgi:ribosomal protein S18 acetylase RimI-like enzyme
VPEPVVVRRAVVDDAPALTALRRSMLAAMGMPGLSDEAWQRDCTAWFRARLARVDSFAAFVVDGPDGPVSSAVGDLQEHAPHPLNPTGRRGHLFNVSTLPSARRRGYARACVERLQQWFLEEQTVTLVELSATPDGRAVYEALGFAEPTGHALIWRIPR